MSGPETAKFRGDVQRGKGRLPARRYCESVGRRSSSAVRCRRAAPRRIPHRGKSTAPPAKVSRMVPPGGSGPGSKVTARRSRIASGWSRADPLAAHALNALEMKPGAAALQTAVHLGGPVEARAHEGEAALVGHDRRCRRRAPARPADALKEARDLRCRARADAAPAQCRTMLRPCCSLPSPDMARRASRHNPAGAPSTGFAGNAYGPAPSRGRHVSDAILGL